MLWNWKWIFFQSEQQQGLPTDIMKIYMIFGESFRTERENLKMKNHRTKTSSWIFNSGSLIIGGEEKESLQTLLLMLHETCNKKINHRMVQFLGSFGESLHLIISGGKASVQFPHIFTFSITKWTSLIHDAWEAGLNINNNLYKCQLFTWIHKDS